jgi:hypothetical protein
VRDYSTANFEDKCISDLNPASPGWGDPKVPNEGGEKVMRSLANWPLHLNHHRYTISHFMLAEPGRKATRLCLQKTTRGGLFGAEFP